MIEEINKLQNTIDKGRCIGIIDDEIGKELLKISIEILDKYNNQEPKATIFIDTEDMEERYGTQLYIEYLEKYKNAWKELENMFINHIDAKAMNYQDNKLNPNEILNKMQELEQKHNLDKE